MSTLLAMAAFSLAMSISPGPVNIITLSIGVNSGYRKALPFVSGATIGFTLLLFLIGIGLGELMTSIPKLMHGLSIIGTAFICYIGVMIAMSDGRISPSKNSLPGFVQGFLLQWLNPKAWAACLSGIAIFATKESNDALYLFVSIYFVVCFFGIACWAVFGEKALLIVSSQAKMRWFNRVMGVSLIVVALYMLYQQFGDL